MKRSAFAAVVGSIALLSFSAARSDAAEPRITNLDPSGFVREMTQLGIATDIDDRAALLKLTGWTPVLREGRAYYRTQEPETKIRELHLVVGVGHDGVKRGTFIVGLKPELFCVRVGDIEAVLGSGRPYAAVHSVLKKDDHYWGFVFPTARLDTTFTARFVYRDCAESLTVVMKNPMSRP